MGKFLFDLLGRLLAGGFFLCNHKHFVKPIHVQHIESKVQEQGGDGQELVDTVPHGPHVAGYKEDRIEAPYDPNGEEGHEQADPVDDSSGVTHKPCRHLGSKPVHVDKGGAQLKDQEARHPRQAERRQGGGKHVESRHRMHEEPRAEQRHILEANKQVPHKVPDGDGCDEPTVWVVAQHSAGRIDVSVLPRRVVPHRNQRAQRYHALNHRNNMYVKVLLGLVAQFRVPLTEEPRRHERGQFLHHHVHQKRPQYFVPMGNQWYFSSLWERSVF